MSKTAIVTGGAGSIGQAISIKLAENYTVIVIDNDTEKINTLNNFSKKNNLNIHPLIANVTDHNKTFELIEFIKTHFGLPYILINCAGITKDASIINMSESDFDDTINVNLKGTFNYIKATAPIFKQEKTGKIVNISSINGIRGKFGQAGYCASKAGINALTKVTAIELGKYNVNVNAIAPGLIESSMSINLPEKYHQKAVEESVLKRTGTPEDVAELAFFLTSEAAKHITGQIIKIDGGQYL